MATANNKVKFSYVTAESKLPVSKDGDTIYFVADTQKLYVGSQLIADHIDAPDLTPYKVKDVTITGTGDYVSAFSFDATSGMISVTKSDLPVKNVVISGTGNTIASATFSNGVLTLTKDSLPVLAKGTDQSATPVTLEPGDTFTVMTDTSVNDHTITDQNTTFTLPEQIASVVASKGDADGKLILTTTLTDGTSSAGTAVALFDPADYATAEQGAKADAAMPAANGTATGAHVTLAANPTADMEASTKKYVDDAVAGITGAMHFLGRSSTPITDGGTEKPTIDGRTVDPSKGDVVLYNGLEFVWDGAKWVQLGDEGSYALKTVAVTAGDGLTGGGTLAANFTISHNTAGETATTVSATQPCYAIGTVSYDEFGHVTQVQTRDLTFDITSIAETEAAAAVAPVQTELTNLKAAMNVAAASGDYVTSISQTNGVISATMGTKGSIASSNTGLVDGGTVYTAIEAAKTDVASVWEVL